MLRSHFLSPCGGPSTAFSPATLWRPLVPRADILKFLKGPCNLNSFLHYSTEKKNMHLFLFGLLWTLLLSLPFSYIEELFSSIIFSLSSALLFSSLFLITLNDASPFSSTLSAGYPSAFTCHWGARSSTWSQWSWPFSGDAVCGIAGACCGSLSVPGTRDPTGSCSEASGGLGGFHPGAGSLLTKCRQGVENVLLSLVCDSWWY